MRAAAAQAGQREQHVSSVVHVDVPLARRILRGDAQAFRTLFDSFFPRLYRFALAHLDGDHDAASEVVQQTFCKAIERLDTYRGEAALYTWFCQICRHTLIDYCRSAQRDRRAVMHIEDEPEIRAVLEALSAPLTLQPDVQVWQRDIRRLVQATVDALPERYGDILEWKYVDGLSVDEIAARLNLSQKAAESLLMRARTAFRGAIADMTDVPEALQPPGPAWSG
jgi:RNA polymerase sigma-70 factor (ECF subfamily)